MMFRHAQANWVHEALRTLTVALDPMLALEPVERGGGREGNAF